MAHELARRDDMFFVGETPWHGLGTRLEGRPTSEEAIKAARLDWEVGMKPLCTYVDGFDGMQAQERVTHKATFKVGTGEILGVVGPGWHPLQNRDAFKFFDAFVAAGQAAYETAGQLRAGKKVWILAEIAGDPLVIVPKADDVARRYILLSNSHDGSMAIRCGYTPVRVVCANTLAAAMDDATSKLIKIRHTSSVKDALAKVDETMNVINKTFEATAEQYRALAAKGCDAETLKKYVNLVFAPRRVAAAMVKKAEDVGGQFAEAVIARALEDGEQNEMSALTAGELRSNVYPKIAKLFEAGRRNDLPGVKGTLWAGYNAISEYLVHERGTDAAKRLESAWFGQGHVQNVRALKAGLELAKAA